VAGVIVSCVAVIGPAFGPADIEPFTSSTTVGPELVDDTCAGDGVFGVMTGTETIDGQLVTTSTGQHFTGTDTLAYRVDFPDGSYLVASQRSPRSFTSAARCMTRTATSSVTSNSTPETAPPLLMDALSRTLTEHSLPAGDSPAIENRNSIGAGGKQQPPT